MQKKINHNLSQHQVDYQQATMNAITLKKNLTKCNQISKNV